MSEMQETQISDSDDSPEWRIAKRVVFRFVFVYLILYGSPFLLFPLAVISRLSSLLSEKFFALWQTPVMQPVISWVGKNILGISYDFTLSNIGSGDQTYYWVQIFCYLVFAALITLVWTLLDRKRVHYAKLHQWLTLFIRLMLALLLITYGAQKVIPVQMPPPSLTRLLQPYGEFSPMTVLWSFMGISPGYSIVTGCIEMLGGILLIFNRTALLGALVSFAAMTQVFLLNMFYDVPVKLLSFHMLLMSIFLLAPHWQRLANVILLNRPAEPVPVKPLFRRKWSKRGMLIFQILFCVFLVGANLFSSYTTYTTYGGGAPKPPLYGIWTVEEFSENGEIRPPLVTDEARWQRVIIQNRNGLFVQPMRGENQFYKLQLDTENKTITLGKSDEQDWKADFTFEEINPGQMRLAGEMDGNHIEAKLVRMDENQFELKKAQGFRWIQDQ